jgi:heme/copper-type cytochrome/quinol oxidase subunit 1
MTPEQYLVLMTMHGTIMVFMALTTAPLSGFGNYFLPIQIGAADMARISCAKGLATVGSILWIREFRLCWRPPWCYFLE